MTKMPHSNYLHDLLVREGRFGLLSGASLSCQRPRLCLLRRIFDNRDSLLGTGTPYGCEYNGVPSCTQSEEWKPILSFSAFPRRWCTRHVTGRMEAYETTSSHAPAVKYAANQERHVFLMVSVTAQRSTSRTAVLARIKLGRSLSVHESATMVFFCWEQILQIPLLIMRYT